MTPVIVSGVCVGETHGLEVDEGCKILSWPKPHDDRHKKSMVRVASPLIPGVFQPTFHYDCWHNQVRAVLGRVIGVVPKPSPAGIARLKDVASWVAGRLPRTQPQDVWAMPARYSGAKRKRYEDAVVSYLHFGVSARDAGCTMFVKSERFDGNAKVNPDPRAIQFRGARYCVAVAQYLQPIEHEVYNMSGFSAGVPPSRNIAKGLNSIERAELLHKKLSAFTSPVVLSLDASRFDKHVSKALLQIEHSVYTSACRNPHFRWLLRLQLVNRVKAANGLKYICEGRRMSGDMNTALGNCLLMLMMVVSYAWSIELAQWDCLDDGDDCLLIVPEEDLRAVQGSLVKHFLDYGMEMKVERVARSLHEVVFCQSSVIEVAGARFKFVRDYRAVISKSLSGIRHWQDPKYRLKVLGSIGICELTLNLGVPILQAFACCLLRNAGRPRDYRHASDGLKARVGRELRALGSSLERISPRPITECARASFAVAFGCPPDEQEYLEAFFDGWRFDIESQYYHGPEWDVIRWVALQSTREVCPLWQNAESSEKEQTQGPRCQCGPYRPGTIPGHGQ